MCVWIFVKTWSLRFSKAANDHEQLLRWFWEECIKVLWGVLGVQWVSTQRSYPQKIPGCPAWRGRVYHILGIYFLIKLNQTSLAHHGPHTGVNTGETHCWIHFWQWMLVLGQNCYVGRCPLTEVWQDESLTLGFTCWNTAPTQLNHKTQRKFNREDVRTC